MALLSPPKVGLPVWYQESHDKRIPGTIKEARKDGKFRVHLDTPRYRKDVWASSAELYRRHVR